MNRPEDILRSILQEAEVKPTIGRYEILDALGRGNMGEVFRARDPMIGRMVALKTRRFDLLYEKQDLQFVINRFFEEARIAGNLVHPNIVTIYDVGQDGEQCYIAMELLEGESLTCCNTKDSLLPTDAVVEMIKKICMALDFAHSHDVIHRDIKPANLMLTTDKNIKLMDFGIALSAHGDRAQGLEVMGTPSYMSPEQTSGLRLTRQSDFFSLGVVMFELLCGQRPFQGRTLYELMDNVRYAPPPSIVKINPSLPPALDVVIEKVLEKEPDLRYSSGAELAEELDRAMKGQSIVVRDFKSSRKAEFLKSIPFFRAFTRDQIEATVRFGRFIRYDKSHVIVREGDTDTTFFILIHGKVKVVKNNKRVATLGAGDCFGEMGAVTRAPRSAHVLAKEPCLVLKLDLKVLERENPELKIKFYELFLNTLSERLATTTRRLIKRRKRKSSDKEKAENDQA